MRVILIAMFACSLFAAAPERYGAPRMPSPVQVDGKLDEWANVPWTSPFVDIEGDSKPKPRFMTRAKIAWDATFLYVAAELEEPHLWATYTKHDSVIFHEHDFEVFLDPDGDTRHYFEFEMNVLNTSWDLYLNKPYRRKGKPDNTWEIPGLKTAVHASGTINDPRDTDKGWTLEIAMPWTAFDRGPRPAAAPKPNETWRINFSRVEWPIVIRDGKYEKPAGSKEANWVWSPQGLINMHVPERWGYVTFVP